MIATSTLTNKNQTTLPKSVVAALGIKPSDQILYEVEHGRVTLRPRKGRLADLARIEPFGPRPTRPFTVEEINTAVARSYFERATDGSPPKRKR